MSLGDADWPLVSTVADGTIVVSPLHGPSRVYRPMPHSDGGADIGLVVFDRYAKPCCVRHGAMNRVSEAGFWRCVTTAGPKSNGCRAGIADASEPR